MTTRANLQRIKHEFIECMTESGADLTKVSPNLKDIETPLAVTARFLLKNLNELIESFPEERFYIDDEHPWHLVDSKNNEKYLPWTFTYSTKNNLKEICDLLNAGDKAINKKSAPWSKPIKD